MPTTRRLTVGHVKTKAENRAAEVDLGVLMRTPGFLIKVLQVQIFDDFYRTFSDLGISPIEYSVLVTVRDNLGVNQSALADALRVHLPNLVKTLSSLEAAGLLSRVRSQKDRRAVELALTPHGRTFAARCYTLAARFNEQTLTALTTSEQRQLISLLGRLVRARSDT